MPISQTPQVPYYAVIFTSLRNDVEEGYREIAERMEELVMLQPGCLGYESVREDQLGITVSYWESLDAIKNWKRQAEHDEAQQKGRATWYKQYKIRICKVERDYGFKK